MLIEGRLEGRELCGRGERKSSWFEVNIGHGSRDSYQLSIEKLVYWMLIRTATADSNGSGLNSRDCRSWVGSNGFVTAVERCGKPADAPFQFFGRPTTTSFDS